MNRIFLIDLENVGSTFLKGAENLTSEDIVILFYSIKYDRIPAAVTGTLERGKNAYRTVRTNCRTKNAMDFQICTYLGYLVAQYGRKTKYYFVTGDKGYDASIEFIRENLSKDICIQRIPFFSYIEEKDDIKKLISEALPGYPRKVVSIVAAGFEKNTTKSGFHNYLQRNLADFRDVYRRVETIFMEEVLGIPFPGKFSIGDKVLIRKDLSEGLIYGNTVVTKEMLPYCGKEAVIERYVTEHESGYLLSADDQHWTWTDDMFEQADNTFFEEGEGLVDDRNDKVG